jgi:hypothetical protein
MRKGLLFAAAAVFALSVGFSALWAQSQTDPQKRQQGPTQVTPPEQKPTTGQPAGQPGGMDDLQGADHAAVVAQIDATVERMTAVTKQAQALSKSFGELAAAHHGADKSEVLMMQRMSDSMGTMAGEIKMSLQQYKKMLEDETSSQSGAMKAEVQSLKAIIDGIARNVEEGIQTLQKMQTALGQG